MAWQMLPSYHVTGGGGLTSLAWASGEMMVTPCHPSHAQVWGERVPGRLLSLMERRRVSWNERLSAPSPGSPFIPPSAEQAGPVGPRGSQRRLQLGASLSSKQLLLWTELPEHEPSGTSARSPLGELLLPVFVVIVAVYLILGCSLM